MTRDTHRDQVWKYIVEHRDLNTEFGEEDIVEHVEASEQTVRDVIQTAVDYGLLDRQETVISPSYDPNTPAEDMVYLKNVFYYPVIPGDEIWIHGMDVPPTKAPANCAQVVTKCVDYLDELCEDETASSRDIVMAIMPDHPLGYDVPDLKLGERPEVAWWQKIVKTGLKAHPNVRCQGDRTIYEIQSINQ
jgi:hypothetical protein